MKPIIKKLKIQLNALREVVEKRQETFEGRTNKWQESDKGLDFEYTTEDIEAQAEELEAIIENLEEL